MSVFKIISGIIYLITIIIQIVIAFIGAIKFEIKKYKDSIITLTFELNKIKKEIFLLRLRENKNIEIISEEVYEETRQISDTIYKLNVRNIQIQYNNAIITVCYDENGFKILLNCNKENKSELNGFIKETKINIERTKRVISILALFPILISAWILGMSVAYNSGVKSDGLMLLCGGIFFIIAGIVYYILLKCFERIEYEFIKLRIRNK